MKENDRNLHLNYMEFDVNTRYPSDIKSQGGWKYNTYFQGWDGRTQSGPEGSLGLDMQS